jgi:nucleoside-diphosphate-sugar epimerase
MSLLCGQKIVVTGGGGALGQHVVAELTSAGYNVLSLDKRQQPVMHKPSWNVDLLNVGSIYEACKSAWGIVHLAAHTAPGLASDCVTFNENVQITYNVLKAASDSGVKIAVLASSTAVYGYLYGLKDEAPDYFPVDERHARRPVDSYGLSKVVGERIADSFAQAGGMALVSLRLPGINYDAKYERVKRLTTNPAYRAPGFWSYIDVRDTAIAVRLALETPGTGHRVFNVACQTSNMHEPTPDLLKAFFPGLVDIRRSDHSNWSGIDSSAASRELGFCARYRWEDAT